MPSKRPPNLTTALPSGVMAYYWDEKGIDGLPQQRRYAYGDDWQTATRLPSVSTISNIFDKPALRPYYATKTVEGVARLLEFIDADQLKGDPDAIQGWLRDQKLDPDSVVKKAADRGTAAHQVLLELLRDGKVPNPQDHPIEWRGYLQAGAAWFIRECPEIIDAETIVASVEHGFAGRYDLHCRFPDGRTCRLDFKTVTDWKYGKPRKDGTSDLLPPFDEHLYQVAGYEVAAVSCGYEPSDYQAVVRLGPDGSYDVTESWAAPEHFLGCLDAYENRQSLHAAKKAAKAVAA